MLNGLLEKINLIRKEIRDMQIRNIKRKNAAHLGGSVE